MIVGWFLQNREAAVRARLGASLRCDPSHPAAKQIVIKILAA
jgi:hypothetical protein